MKNLLLTSTLLATTIGAGANAAVGTPQPGVPAIFETHSNENKLKIIGQRFGSGAKIFIGVAPTGYSVEVTQYCALVQNPPPNVVVNCTFPKPLNPGEYRLLVSTDGGNGDFDLTVGAQGATGPSGAPGAAGPAGTPGSTGPAGAPGTQGSAGPVGPSGSAGPVGPAGSAGPNGAPGPKGDAGTQGSPGLAGPAGPAGPNGAAGPAGHDGAAGPKGDAGLAGPTGPAGATGPMGTAGASGHDGAPGPAGGPGATGPVGPAGMNGAPGPQGPVGPNGAPGNNGAPGPQGSAGPAGPQGTFRNITIVTDQTTSVAPHQRWGTSVSCPVGMTPISGSGNYQNNGGDGFMSWLPEPSRIGTGIYSGQPTGYRFVGDNTTSNDAVVQLYLTCVN